MRIFTSKISLVLVSILFLAALVWIIGGNDGFFSPLISHAQDDGQGINASLDSAKVFAGNLIEWIYRTAQPFAKEMGSAFQSWWDAQKVIIVDQLIRWLSNQAGEFNATLQNQLRLLVNGANTAH
jgi:hypothetical protein